MEKPKNPCLKTCPKRTSGCHATCKEGREFFEQMAKWREEERKKNAPSRDAYMYHRETVVRNKKRRNTM